MKANHEDLQAELEKVREQLKEQMETMRSIQETLVGQKTVAAS